MTTSRDLLLLLGLAGFLAACGIAGFVSRRRVVGLLTKREWIVLAKLVGIGGLVFLLLIVKISRALPHEMFIYGRF